METEAGQATDVHTDESFEDVSLYTTMLAANNWNAPTVGYHRDLVVSWDTVGGIQALGCPQGPPKTGFGFAKNPVQPS